MRIGFSFGHLSIRQKLMTLLVGLACLTAIAVSVPLGIYDYFSSKKAVSRHLGITADVLAWNVADALTAHSRGGAEQILQGLRAEPNITAAYICAADGEVFASYLRDKTGSVAACRQAQMPPWHGERVQLVEIRKIRSSGETMGTLYIESDRESLRSRSRGYYLVSLLTLTIVIALAFIIAERLQRPISHRLLELVRTAKTIAERDDYSIRAHLPNRDEFGLLVSAFNGMLEQIENRDHALCDYHEHLEEQVVARTDALSKANMRLALQAAALQAAVNSIVITDRERKIVWTNSAFSVETGFAAEEVIGQQPRMLLSGEHRKSVYDEIWQAIKAGQVWRGEVTSRRKDGTSFIEEMSLTPVRSELGEITHFVAIKQNITRRKQAQDALRKAEEKYRGMFEDAVVGIYQTTPGGKLLNANRALALMCGYDSPEQLIAGIEDIAHDLWEDPHAREEFKSSLGENGVVRNFEHQIRRKDGSLVWLLHNARVVRNDKGEILFYEGTAHDVTERKTLEEQLRQSQKMEAVGRLAGGVAHDFNNALGVIMGYGELIELNLPPDSPMHKHAKEIIKAGQRAASLTRQLLAFSRKQTIQPVVLDLNAVIVDTEKMLQRLIGEDIDLTIVRESRLKNVKADRGQITQILMNLAVNARDAMPGGGKLLIETSNTELTEVDARQYHFIKPGRFVLLRISDTGCGIDSHTLAHIFEPFFTTKAEGMGTGLGLSTVYGIVKQSNGYVLVDSEVGTGTMFRIYLPQVEQTNVSNAAEQPRVLPPGNETILLVEDEDGIRGLVRGCLHARGYKVLEAPNAPMALNVARQHHGRIDLLLTDVIMPGMNGRDLAITLSGLRPEIKILYTSGYTDDRLSSHGVLEPGVALLMKPFTIESLLVAVRNVLDGKSAFAAGAAVR